MDDVIDIVPRLLLRRQSACEHDQVSVGLTVRSLTCNACDAELDPWWYIRREAQREETLREETERLIAAKYAAFNAQVDRMNATLRRLQADIESLTSTKNRLMNETVNGRLVGNATRSRRRT